MWYDTQQIIPKKATNSNLVSGSNGVFHVHKRYTSNQHLSKDNGRGEQGRLIDVSQSGERSGKYNALIARRHS